MNPSPWLLAALVLAECGSKQGEIEFGRPEFHENANRTTSPADLRYPADSFRAGEARFIHGHLVATQPSGGAASFVPVCVLLDSAITTPATVTDTVTFAKGSNRAEWEVRAGGAGTVEGGLVPGSLRGGQDRTNATFTVVP